MSNLSGRPSDSYTIVGSGPNGLAAAIHLAQNGKRVKVLEAEATLGGAARTAELTLPGFRHDLGSAVHPLAVTSPFLRTLPLACHGLEWIDPPLALAHPLDDGTAVGLARSFDETAESIGGPDGKTYRRLLEPLAWNLPSLFEEILGPLHLPSHPWVLARFAPLALRSARGLAESKFEGVRARALFAGLAMHSFLDLRTPTSAAIGLVLALAGHAKGWPIPRGGAGAITQAMASYFESLGGRIELSHPVESEEDLSDDSVLFDVDPHQLLKIAPSLPRHYRSELSRFRRGPGVFKLDYALSAPIPWKAKECRSAGTIHLGGSLEQIEEGGFVLLSQPTIFDPTRAPEGKHVVWAYCHVPFNSNEDRTELIESQIERFAPGFKEVILKRTRSFPSDLERQNRSLHGGDISGGAPTPMQLFFRPAPRWDPYRIPGRKLWWICSSSTPPGAGVHGMCGFHAAESALRHG